MKLWRWLCAIFRRRPPPRKGMQLWLDDKRLPHEGWTWFKTAAEAIHALQTESVEAVSLDHDLGPLDTCGSGYEVAKHIESMAHEGTLPRLAWHLHTQNVVGRRNMEAALRSADAEWDKRDR